MRVLFLTADQELSFALSTELTSKAWTVDWVRDGLSALGLAASQAYDLMVLDLKALHLSSFSVEEFALCNRGKLLLLDDPNQAFDEAEMILGDGCITECISTPFIVPRLLASVNTLNLLTIR